MGPLVYLLKGCARQGLDPAGPCRNLVVYSHMIRRVHCHHNDHPVECVEKHDVEEVGAAE